MKCIIPTPEPTEEQLQEQERKAIKHNNRILDYADQMLCLSLRENAGFGYRRFLKYNNESVELGRYYVDRFTMDDEAPEEYAVSSYYALALNLKDWGWNPEEHLWKESVFDKYPPDHNSAAMRKQHKIRMEYVKGISFYVREMLCMAALWMREELGWAEIRLDRVFRQVVEEYLESMRDYLRCTTQGDTRMNDRIDATKKKYNDMGIFTPAK